MADGLYARATLNYVDKSLDNVADLPRELIWRNYEVVQMLEDIRATLVTGVILPGSFADVQVGGQS